MPLFLVAINRLKAMLTNPNFLRLMSGYVYFHFGILKFFSDLSSAEMLAEQTIMRLSFELLNAGQGRLLLATMECVIGLALLFKFQLRWIFGVFIFHLLFTFSPLFLYPEICFKIFPLAPTLEGQFIIKNVVLFAAAWVVMYPLVFANKNTPSEGHLQKKSSDDPAKDNQGKAA